MLILTRNSGEQIRIGDNVIVTVIRITEDSVKIGIEAPLDFPIVRRELLSDDARARSVLESEDPLG